MVLGRPTIPLPRNARVYAPQQVVEVFRTRYDHVATFLGFGELGYNDPDRFADIVQSELRCLEPRRTVINTATLITDGFEYGVADAYEIAVAFGFRTVGIFPSIALRTPDRYSLSAFVGDVYFVEDHSWGGYLDGTTDPSNTLAALSAVTDEVVAIGGGNHTAQEIREMLRRRKPVRYHELRMNHEVSVRWYGEHNQLVPDARGEAFFVFCTPT